MNKKLSKYLYLPAMAVLAYFIWLMILITVQYIPVDLNAAFLNIKQDMVGYRYYQIAFFTHVYTSVFLLFAGFTQFSKKMRTGFPAWHRKAGYAYIVIILLFSAPSGFIMGYHANGGWTSKLAFCLLSILWFTATLLALLYARKRDFKAHRRFMLRSYALTLSAISLRLWKWLFVALWHPAPMDVYRTVAWLGWGLNLLIIEIYIFRKLKPQLPQFSLSRLRY